MDDRDWYMLRALRETRNITRAAELLNTSQPGLSKRLRLLEERFGLSIALRNKGGIEFTPAGECIMEYGAEMIDRLQALHERLDDMGAEIKGTLRIGASNYCISYILPQLLAAFKQEYPHVEFLVTSAWSSDIIKKVGSGEVHIGFIRNDNLLLPERILLCTERTFICSTKAIDLERLPEEPQIAYKSDPVVASELHTWWAENYKTSPRIAMMVDRLGSSVEMVLEGLGYAFLSEKMTEKMQGVQRYEIRHPDGRLYLRNTWVVPNPDAKQLRLVSCFLEFIAKQARG